jgi:hypothetical protein
MTRLVVHIFEAERSIRNWCCYECAEGPCPSSSAGCRASLDVERHSDLNLSSAKLLCQRSCDAESTIPLHHCRRFDQMINRHSPLHQSPRPIPNAPHPSRNPLGEGQSDTRSPGGLLQWLPGDSCPHPRTHTNHIKVCSPVECS